MSIVTGKKSTYTCGVHKRYDPTCKTILPKVPRTSQIDKHHNKVFLYFWTTVFVEIFIKAFLFERNPSRRSWSSRCLPKLCRPKKGAISKGKDESLSTTIFFRSTFWRPPSNQLPPSVSCRFKYLGEANEACITPKWATKKGRIFNKILVV